MHTRQDVYIRRSLLPFNIHYAENMRVYLVILLLGLAFASAANEDGMLFLNLCIPSFFLFGIMLPVNLYIFIVALGIIKLPLESNVTAFLSQLDVVVAPISRLSHN